MRELRKQIQSILKTICNNVYYENGIKSYPYVVFEITELTYDAGKHSCQLEINVINKGTDTTIVEQIADDIQKLLDSIVYSTPNLQFRVFKGARKIVREEDKQIKRRRLLFELYYYMKGE